MNPVVQVQGLVKRFGHLTAVDDVSFHVNRGEIFGLLGENGAGKTTTIEMLEGFQRPDKGTVHVLGETPQHARREWRDQIGVVLQESDFDPLHSVKETLSLFASFFSHPRERRRDPRPRRTHGQGQREGRATLGWAEAAHRRRSRHRRVDPNCSSSTNRRRALTRSRVESSGGSSRVCARRAPRSS